MKRRHISITALFLLAAPAWPQITLNPLPSRTVGHPKTPQPEQNTLYSTAPNLVEGRELSQPGGIAVDTSMSPSPIYVADSGNNRVLGWKDVASFTNGQKADLVIGQNDFFTTWAQGPNQPAHAPGQGTALQSGLNAPSGLAARNGDLYVADSGNNRVLRYPQVFTNTSHIPDLVIGQSSLAGSGANYTGAVSAQGVSLSGNRSNIAFDADGNLWMTDPANRRVLEFAAADVATSGKTGLTAILEIGQANFTSLLPNLNPAAAGVNLTPDHFALPVAIAFDSHGRLYVSDADPNQPQNLSRVLVFVAPFANAMAATRIMGVFQATTGVTPDPAQTDAIEMDDPESIFFTGDQVGVVDSLYHRILLFPPFEQWPDATTQVSPSASAVIGHNSDFTRLKANDQDTTATVLPQPSASVLNRPVGAVFANNELYVVDGGNNRVLAYPSPLTGTSAATRVLGQDYFSTGSAELVESRGFQIFLQDSSGTRIDSGLAIDYSTGPTPHLYMADTYNNRVLGFRDLRQVSAGVGADIVIGQPNGQTSVCNYPTGDPLQPTNSSLCNPVGIAVDSKGDLWVVDRVNARVLRFPAPFAQTGQPVADLVLGQSSFTAPKVTTDPTPGTMASPYGVAVSVNGTVMVSDQVQNRVLIFAPVNGTFTNGQPAASLLGQANFNSAASGTGLDGMNGPRHVAFDSNDRPYVVDGRNNRVLIYDSLDDPSFPPFGAAASFSLTGFSAPEGICVSPSTGEIWVADTNAGAFKRFPPYLTLVTSSSSTGVITSAALTAAVVQDQFGALVGADATNRLALYYPGLTAQNLANNLSARPLAPGAIAAIIPSNAAAPFGSTTADFAGQIPLPTTIANVQVLFDGAAVPLFMVSPSQINFYVPMSARTSGVVNLQVVDTSTGQVYGAGLALMNSVSPGLFLNPLTATGTARQAAVINAADGSVNGPLHPAIRGTWIEIFGTGQGFVTGAPADGDVSTGLVPTAARPVVLLNGVSVDAVAEFNGDGTPFNHIYYSGLAPGLVGVWQINVKIPLTASPGSQIPLTVFASNFSGIPSYDFTKYVTTIVIQ